MTDDELLERMARWHCGHGHQSNWSRYRPWLPLVKAAVEVAKPDYDGRCRNCHGVLTGCGCMLDNLRRALNEIVGENLNRRVK